MDGLIGLQARSADQVDAVGDRGEYRLQVLADGLRSAREVHDQGLPSDARSLAGKDGGRDVFQGCRPHGLAEAREDLVADSLCRLGRHVPRGRARPPGRQDQAAPGLVRHPHHLGLEERPLVGDHLVIRVEGGGEPFEQERDARLSGGVLVDPGARAVGHVDDSDARGHLDFETPQLETASSIAWNSGPFASSKSMLTDIVRSSARKTSPSATTLNMSFCGGFPTMEASVKRQ